MANVICEREDELLARLRAPGESEVRTQIVVELGGYTSTRVIRALCSMIEDNDDAVSVAACNALVKIGGPEVAREAAGRLADDPHNRYAELLGRLGQNSVHALESRLKDEDKEQRRMAIGILGQIRHERAAMAVIPMVYDKDPVIVLSAVEALGGIGDPSAVPHLERVFEKDEYARPAIAEALGKIGGQDAAEFLACSFQNAISAGDADNLTLFRIIEALGIIGNPETFALLSHHLPSVRGKLRRTVLAALIWISDKSGLPLDIPAASKEDLIELLDDEDMRVRLNAVRALADMSGETVTNAFLRTLGSSSYVDAVLFGILEQRDGVFDRVLDELENPGCAAPDQLLFLLRTIVKFNSQRGTAPASPGLQERAMTVVAGRWDRADETSRAAIAETMFLINPAGTLLVLETLMKDQDPWMRMRVIELLGTLDNDALPEFVARYLDDEDEMVRSTAEWVLEAKGCPSRSVRTPETLSVMRVHNPL